MYTLMCIKLMTNKNLLYKKNKLKFKNSMLSKRSQTQKPYGTSLVAQQLRIRLPMQGMQVQALVRE